MKVTCPKSGIIYDCPTFNIPGVHSQAEHPLFALSTKQLLGLFEHTFSSEQVSSTDQYLLSLALLNKLPNTWIATVNQTEALPHSLKHLESLAKLVERLERDSRMLQRVPSICIDKSTSDLANLSNWIVAYDEALAEAVNVSLAFRKGKEVSRLESVIDGLIAKGFERNKTRISKVVSNWACVAGEFPASVKELWTDMVVLAFSENFLQVLGSQATLADYDELVEHCEDNIPHGSTLASVLMKKIRAAREMIREFTQPTKAEKLARLSNLDLSAIAEGDEVAVTVKHPDGQESQIIGIVAQPQRSQFPDGISYIRAITAWRKKHGLA